MIRPNLFIILLIAIGLLGAKVSTAYALPPLPSSFYGTVKINGANVPNDATVSARINGIQYATTTVMLYSGETVYSLTVPGDDSATPEVEGGVPGNTIVFFIGIQAADQASTWQSGTNIELNLTAQVMVLIFLPLLVR